MPQQVLVSERALLSRINRVLSRESRRMNKTRENSRWYSNLGGYSVVNIYRNCLVDTHVDLEAYAREKGVLKGYERLAVGG